MEKDLAFFAKVLENDSENKWITLSEKRKALIEKLCWNEKPEHSAIMILKI